MRFSAPGHLKGSAAPAPFATRLVEAHCPGLPGRLTRTEAQMSEVEEGALVHCADAFQYGPTSVSSAGSQPAPVMPLPSPSWIHIYICIKVL